MAVRSNAAAAPGPKDGAFMSFNVVCSSQNIVDLPVIHKEFSPKHIYDRQSLLDIGNAYKYELSPADAEKLQGLCLLLEPDLETAGSLTRLLPRFRPLSHRLRCRLARIASVSEPAVSRSGSSSKQRPCSFSAAAGESSYLYALPISKRLWRS